MILLTGGAGYIGSHVAKKLLEQNQSIIIIDNLSTGHYKTIEQLKTIGSFIFIHASLDDVTVLQKLFSTYSIDTIMHFAASTKVEESINHPLTYYLNNTVNTTHLIHCAVTYHIKKFIFSSTAAVYGNIALTHQESIPEDCSTNPINPYGKSKLMCEEILQESMKQTTLKYVIFRYFNVCGANIDDHNNKIQPIIGQRDDHPTHLLKIAAECATKKNEKG